MPVTANAISLMLILVKSGRLNAPSGRGSAQVYILVNLTAFVYEFRKVKLRSLSSGIV